MPARRRPLPAQLPAGFSTGQAQNAGVGHARLGAPDLERIARGWYVRRDSLPAPHETVGAHTAQFARELHRTRAHAAARLLGPNRFFAGRTAAALWGLPVDVEPGADLEIATHFPHRATRRRGVRASQVQPHLARVVRHNGIALTSPESTWAALAARLPVRDGVALGDAVIHTPRIPGTDRLRRRPLATIESLEDEIGCGLRRGAAQLRRLLVHLSPHSASPPESHLRLLLLGVDESLGRRAGRAEGGRRGTAGSCGSAGPGGPARPGGTARPIEPARSVGATLHGTVRADRFSPARPRLPEPELDVDVRDRHGTLLGCSEIAYPEYTLAVEYEGEHHLRDPRQWNRDIEKYHDYAAAGWEVVRVTSQMLYRNPESTRHRVAEALRRRGWSEG